MTPEEGQILKKARENLDAAELLLAQGYLEIAASRAYYAMFYLAEALLLRKSLHFSSHSAVLAAFGKEFARTGDLDSKYHQYLIKAQAIRLMSDYGYNEPLPFENVQEVIQRGKEFLQVAEAYLRD